MSLQSEFGSEIFEGLELVGEGLTSWVYKGKRKELPGLGIQIRALKVLKDPSKTQQLETHFKKLAAVRSRHLPAIWALHHFRDHLAVEMDWIDGASLKTLLEQNSLDFGLLEEVTAQLQIALFELHDLGLFHGDLHAGNILVTQEGSLRLIDFAPFVDSAALVEATPDTMAPETWQTGAVTSGSDWFALGLLYEDMMTWRGRTVRTLPELKSRALQAISPESPWFKVKPEERGPEPRFRSCSVARARLGRAVAEVVGPSCSGSTTRQIVAKEQPVRLLGALLPFLKWGLGIFVLAILPTMQTQGAKPDRQVGQIEFRSEEWIQFDLNAKPHFAPAQIPRVPSGVHKLTWRTKRNTGKVTITVMPGQRTVLTYSPQRGIEAKAVLASFPLRPSQGEKPIPSRAR